MFATSQVALLNVDFKKEDMNLYSSNLRGCVEFSRNCILTIIVGISFGFASAYLLLNFVHLDRTDVSPCPLCTVQKNVQSHKAITRKPRILCWILTQPQNHNVRDIVIKETWGKRCDILLFMSSAEDKDLPAIGLDVLEGGEYLWGKTREAFAYIHKHYLDQADWFMKADDDTYVVVENLRYMLQAHNPDDPVYFGRKFVKQVIKRGYMSGGPGYVLSREAVKRLVEDGLPDNRKCKTGSGGNEDLEVGKCLENVGVVAGDSTDCLGKGRFFPLDPEEHIIPGRISINSWYYMYTNTSYAEGTDCCSDTSISFHHVGPELMRVFDYFIHQLRPYGINNQLNKNGVPYC